MTSLWRTLDRLIACDHASVYQWIIDKVSGSVSHLAAPREPLVILTKFLRYLWSIIERMHGKEESIYWIDSKNKNHQNMCIIRLIIEELSEIWLKTITLPDVEMK